jgi:Uma2 family endonuclease
MPTLAPPLTLVFGDARNLPGDNNFAFNPPRITDDEAFWEFCLKNPALRMERDADGVVKIMPPATGFQTGNRNFEIVRQLAIWNSEAGEPGYGADSSTGFRLPNGATRSPDASWTRRDRIDALTPAERTRFAPLCPDFVIELLSPTDTLIDTQAKMEEYIENGAGLGFLIDAENRTVHVYRPNQEPTVLINPAEVSADPELPGFTLVTARIF